MPKQHPEYKNMYYAELPDGGISADFYNLSRVKDIEKFPEKYFLKARRQKKRGKDRS